MVIDSQCEPTGAGNDASPTSVSSWEDVIEALTDGLSVVSAAGVVLFVSARSAELNGFRKEEVIGRQVQDLVRAGYVDRSPSMEVILTKTDVTLVQTVRDGRKLLVSGKPVFATDGSFRGVVVTQRDITELHHLMHRLDETTRLSERYRTELRVIEMREVEGERIVARSASMRAVRELALRCAGVDAPVLILGETGTGKSIFAKLIHQTSARSAGSFIEVNCGAIPDGLIEAELFGYVAGAFTGADPRGKPGLVELAHQGTLLLDEVGEIPLSIQVKLLRFLEDGEVQPVGGVKRKRIDARVLAATNRDVSAMIAEGLFREDLFYRLNVLTIRVPALRQHREDIPWLIEMMLSQLERKLHRRRRLTPRALQLIAQQPFPGNVRELWNLIERLVITTDSETIDVSDLPSEIPSAGAGGAGKDPDAQSVWRRTLRGVEVEILKDAMKRCGSQALAAKYLGIGQATISRKLRQHGLT